ncbi:MAG TPA: tetratricopeptide repeat protein [Candidatus Melainabacteria bacterium]|nr:tetratricopeptide repeat protein [Candidatus Melainabacteria bacterium]
MSYEPDHDDDRAKGVGELLKEAATAIKLRRYAEAEDFCVQALGVLDKASAIEHPSKAMALEFMGDALTGMEKYEEAGRFYKRAMDLSERVFSQENQVYISGEIILCVLV